MKKQKTWPILKKEGNQWKLIEMTQMLDLADKNF